MELFIGDGIQYMKDHKNEFDVIITDAPDPIGIPLNKKLTFTKFNFYAQP